MNMLHWIWIVILALLTRSAGAQGSKEPPRLVTIEEALRATRQNNFTWESLGEFLVQADAARDMGIGMFLPKLTATGDWLHLGERHTPDVSGFADMGMVLSDLMAAVIEEHPNQADRFSEYLDMIGGDDTSSTFESFIPRSDTFSATFSVLVPVFNPQSIPGVQAAYDRYDATLQRVGHGREELLYMVSKAYYGLCTLQSMIEVAKRSVESSEEHYRSSRIRADLQAATLLEVKRAELEVARNQSRKIELMAQREKALAAFRYLTGLQGDFCVQEPDLPQLSSDRQVSYWLELSGRQRKDLAGARIEVLVAGHELSRARMKYAPSLNLFGALKADNAEAQRFDNDPFSWTVGGSLSIDIWDGGIREAEIELSRSKFRQAELKESDLERKVKSEVSSAYQALKDAVSVRMLAERQLDVARVTQQLGKASEKAGTVTYLEVIDANTMVFNSEAQYRKATFDEAAAILDLLSSCGAPVPFEKVSSHSANVIDKPF